MGGGLPPEGSTLVDMRYGNLYCCLTWKQGARNSIQAKLPISCSDSWQRYMRQRYVVLHRTNENYLSEAHIGVSV